MISCRSTDETPVQVQEPAPFFNINVGNKWVYKTYENNDFTNPQSPTTFKGRIDSVSIVGTVNIAGLTFAKQRTKIIDPNSNLNNRENFRYLRVNSKGHLVYIYNLNDPNITETSGHVLHPGIDKTFTYSYDFMEMNQIMGNLFYQINSEKNVQIEGNSYLVTPYLGAFTPSSNQPNLIKKTQEISYKKGLGLVKEICHSLYGKNYLETRLVSATIK